MSPTTTASPWLTIEQLADRLQTTVQATYKLRHLGKLPPAVRVGKSLRFHVDDVIAWERTQRAAGK